MEQSISFMKIPSVNILPQVEEVEEQVTQEEGTLGILEILVVEGSEEIQGAGANLVNHQG